MSASQPALSADHIRRRLLDNLDHAIPLETAEADNYTMGWKDEPGANAEKNQARLQHVYDDDPPPSFFNRLNITAYRTLRYERDRVHRLQDELALVKANRDALAEQLKQVTAERDWQASECARLEKQIRTRSESTHG